jgi:hypothetical protein
MSEGGHDEVPPSDDDAMGRYAKRETDQGGTPMNTKLETITPEKAARILEKNRNRRISVARVKALVDAMLSEQWQMTGQTIQIDKDGYLVDGQHRLTAIVRSNRSQQFLVVRNVDSEAREVTDYVRPRSASDVLKMHGFASPSKMAGISRLLMMVDDGSLAGTPSVIHNMSIKAFAEQNRGMLDWFNRTRQAKLNGSFYTESIIAAAAALYRIDDHEYADGLLTGQHLGEKDARMAARRALQKGTGRKLQSRSNQLHTYNTIVTAYSLWKRGIERFRLTVPEDCIVALVKE